MYPFTKPSHSVLSLEPMEDCKRCNDALPQSLLDDNGHCPECIRELNEQAEAEDDAKREQLAQAMIERDVRQSMAHAIQYGKAMDAMLKLIFPS